MFFCITLHAAYLSQLLSMGRFHSVVVITSALHAEGPGFKPQWNQRSFSLKISLRIS